MQKWIILATSLKVYIFGRETRFTDNKLRHPGDKWCVQGLNSSSSLCERDRIGWHWLALMASCFRCKPYLGLKEKDNPSQRSRERINSRENGRNWRVRWLAELCLKYVRRLVCLKKSFHLSSSIWDVLGSPAFSWFSLLQQISSGTFGNF